MKVHNFALSLPAGLVNPVLMRKQCSGPVLGSRVSMPAGPYSANTYGQSRPQRDIPPSNSLHALVLRFGLRIALQ
jgi:hypothetical protein